VYLAAEGLPRFAVPAARSRAMAEAQRFQNLAFDVARRSTAVRRDTIFGITSRWSAFAESALDADPVRRSSPRETSNARF